MESELQDFFDLNGVIDNSQRRADIRNLLQRYAGNSQAMWIALQEEHYGLKKFSSQIADRTSTKVLIIGPGFGCRAAPAFERFVRASGFQVRVAHVGS